MRYSDIHWHEVADGEGVRVALFVSGCRNRCEGCFQPETWDFNNGELYTAEVENSILEACEPYYIAGLSILGGEPLEPENQPYVYGLIERFRMRFGYDKTIWLYTGYQPFSSYLPHDEFQNPTPRTKYLNDILRDVDVIVQGRFDVRKKDITLKWRGSSNQTIVKINQECY